MWILSVISVPCFLSSRGLLYVEKWLFLLLSSASRCRDWSGLWSKNSKWISFLFCPCFQRNMFLLAFAIEILFPALHFMLMRCHVFCEMGRYRLSKSEELWGAHGWFFMWEKALWLYNSMGRTVWKKKISQNKFLKLSKWEKRISKQ